MSRTRALLCCAALAFPACPATPVEDSAALARQVLAEHGCKIVSDEAHVIDYGCPDQTRGSLDLANLDKQLAGERDPEARRERTRRFVGSLFDLARPSDDAFPKGSILFSIKSQATLDATMTRIQSQIPPQKRAQNAILEKPLAGDARVVLVVDRPQTLEVVTKSHLEKWKVRPSDLFEAAGANLAALPAKPARWSGDDKLAAYQTNDSYDAARILLPQARQALASLLGGPVVFGLPRRDLLLAARADDPTAIQSLRTAIAAEAEKDYGITTDVLCFDEVKGFAVVPAGSPFKSCGR